MKRIMTFMAACAIAAPVFAQNAAVVNGQEIPDTQVEEFVKMMTEQGAEDTPKLREQVREELINRTVMVQAAEAAGIAQNPEVQTELELARQSVLIRGLFNDFLAQHPVTDEQLEAEYEKIRASNQQQEYRSHHILVEEEDQARAVIDRLNQGEDFDAIAKAESQDPGSGQNGGDLGWASADSYVQPFAEALTTLEPGQTTQEPVQSSFGWHVIRLDDTRTAEFPPLDQVRPQLEEMLRQQALARYQEDLRKAASVE